MAFAAPAASVPPTSVQKTSQSSGRHSARGQDHRRHGRDQQQLDDARLGQRDVGADAVAQAGRGRPVRACLPSRCRLDSPARRCRTSAPRSRRRTTPPASSAQIAHPAPGAARPPTARAAVVDLQRADDHLNGVQRGRGADQSQDRVATGTRGAALTRAARTARQTSIAAAAGRTRRRARPRSDAGSGPSAAPRPAGRPRRSAAAGR